ncbi:unnamed protein product [Caenorhabditis auriculariae]|uniref:Uncharacterized protein n=1 Tax=Caenorhabditis auriculariae TaxID=2777116 RepID=A0A8S1HCI5_9PELO|nr:unnamed protein product [Caenorhabditis auriculariae]
MLKGPRLSSFLDLGSGPKGKPAHYLLTITKATLTAHLLLWLLVMPCIHSPDHQKHTYKLYYTDSRGRAEPIRLIFHYFHTRFDDFRMTMEQVPEFKPKSPMHQFPFLEIDGGKTMLCQTVSVCRYLGKSLEPDLWFGGATKTDSAKVDMYADAFSDVFNTAMMAKYADESIRETMMKNAEKTLHVRLSILQDHIKNSKGDYFVGKKVHWCDLYILGVLGTLEEYDDHLLDELSELRHYYLRMRNLPQIKEYIDGNWPATKYHD